MEAVEGGTLDYYFCDDEKFRLLRKPKVKKFIAYELARALEYVHSLRRTHGSVPHFFAPTLFIQMLTRVEVNGRAQARPGLRPVGF